MMILFDISSLSKNKWGAPFICTIKSEHVEYKTGWNPRSIMHTLSAFANDLHNLGGGYVVVGVAEENGQPLCSTAV